MKADFSKEVFEKYFGPSRGLVVITLHDRSELTGKLTGFFRGEPEFGEPYIIRWRFVKEEDLNEINFLPYPNQEAGLIIYQRDIADIRLITD